MHRFGIALSYQIQKKNPTKPKKRHMKEPNREVKRGTTTGQASSLSSPSGKKREGRSDPRSARPRIIKYSIQRAFMQMKTSSISTHTHSTYSGFKYLMFPILYIPQLIKKEKISPHKSKSIYHSRNLFLSCFTPVPRFQHRVGHGVRYIGIGGFEEKHAGKTKYVNPYPER